MQNIDLQGFNLKMEKNISCIFTGANIQKYIQFVYKNNNKIAKRTNNE